MTITILIAIQNTPLLYNFSYNKSFKDTIPKKSANVKHFFNKIEKKFFGCIVVFVKG